MLYLCIFVCAVRAAHVQYDSISCVTIVFPFLNIHVQILVRWLFYTGANVGSTMGAPCLIEVL